MSDKLALLVVDISQSLEDWLKANERGYFIDFDCLSGRWIRTPQADMAIHVDISYPHGSLRAGFNAIIDTVSFAHMRGKRVYASYLYDGWSDGEEKPSCSFLHYVKKRNIFEKTTHSAFQSGNLASRLEKDECKHLMILGYDRDCCVLATAEDAVKRGIKMVACEQLMLTKEKSREREASLNYFRKNTIFLETLVDAWNYIIKNK